VGDKAQHGKEVGESVAQQKDGTKTTTQLKWIPFLESKFLYALQILGANASPSKIKIIMNMDTVTTKQISAHLQCQTCEGCDAQPGGTNYPVA
uniref:HTH myb-type domain-containing protein n=2 Tax=Aegilops tauschii subsp. strangulata TaxID=200361 RepID=A0A452XDL8_AEGTS